MTNIVTDVVGVGVVAYTNTIDTGNETLQTINLVLTILGTAIIVIPRIVNFIKEKITKAKSEDSEGGVKITIGEIIDGVSDTVEEIKDAIEESKEEE